MVQTDCPFCKNEVPAKSRFCNGCGAALRPDPCRHCGVVNAADALTCRRCGGELPGRSRDANAALMRFRAPSRTAASAAQPAQPAQGAGAPSQHPSLLAEGFDRVGGLATAVDEHRDPVAYEVRFEQDQTVKIGAKYELDVALPDAQREGSLVHAEAELLSAAAAATSGTSLAVAPSAHDPRSAGAPASGARVPPVGPGAAPLLRMPLFLAGVGVAALAIVLYLTLRQQPSLELKAPPSAGRDVSGVDNGDEARRAGRRDGGGVRAESAALTPAAAAPTQAGANHDMPVTPPRTVAGPAQPRQAAPQGEPSPTQVKAPITVGAAAAPPTPLVIAPAVAPTLPGASREARSAPQVPAAMAEAFKRPGPAAAAAAPKPANLGPCTEAVAALGLCAPESIQRRQ